MEQESVKKKNHLSRTRTVNEYANAPVNAITSDIVSNLAEVLHIDLGISRRTLLTIPKAENIANTAKHV